MSIKIKQHDITDCGAACLASVASHYKLKMPIAKIRQYASTDKRGTNILGMIKAAEKLGFSAKGVKGQIDSLTKIPLPGIAHVIVNNNLHHFVVVYKVDGKHVNVMDPGNGKMKKYKLKEWTDIWTGVLIILVPGEDFQKGNNKVSVLRRFIFLMKPHKFIFVQALFGAMLYTILGLSISIYIQKITDHVLIEQNTNLLNLLSVGMIVILFIQIFVSATKSVFILKTGQQIDAQLILGYYKHLLTLPQQFFDTMRIGEIVSRIGDAVKIRVFINDVLITVFVNIFIIIFSFALMFTYYWKLALIVLLIIPLQLVVYLITNYLNKKTERKLMERGAELESQLFESISNVRTIKQFGVEDYVNIITENRFIKLLNTTYQSGINSIFSSNSAELINRLFVILLLWNGAIFVIDHRITPGELLSFYAIIGYFTSPVNGLIQVNKTIQNALIAADRLFEIMDLDKETQGKKIIAIPENVGDIKLENVHFSYGTRMKVFDNLTLTIRQGEITAIVGESGSGKSTLISLLQKLYTISDGSIRIGDLPLNHIDEGSLRNLVSVVPQKVDMFTGSIIENIALGDFEPDMHEVFTICQTLGILNFIKDLPEGLETHLSERGNNLSGGQKQRIGIARALYKNPEIIIFDEATSALDSVSESFVKNTIKNLRREGKTIIFITHRLSSAVMADNIVVIDQGQAVETGSHQELIHKDGKYAQMWIRQMHQTTGSNRIQELRVGHQ